MIRAHRGKLAVLCGLALGGFFLGSALSAAEYTGQSSRDPFSSPPGDLFQAAAPVISGPAAPSITLGGIIWVPQKPRAILNGKRVLVGETVAGATVIEIRKKEVVIRLNGQELILKPQRKN